MSDTQKLNDLLHLAHTRVLNAEELESLKALNGGLAELLGLQFTHVGPRGGGAWGGPPAGARSGGPPGGPRAFPQRGYVSLVHPEHGPVNLYRTERMNAQTAASRLLYGMGRDKTIPAIFGKVHSKILS